MGLPVSHSWACYRDGAASRAGHLAFVNLSPENAQAVMDKFKQHPAVLKLPKPQRFKGNDLGSIKGKWFLGERGSASHDPDTAKGRGEKARDAAQRFFEALDTVAEWDKIETKKKIGTGVLLQMQEENQAGLGGGKSIRNDAA